MGQKRRPKIGKKLTASSLQSILFIHFSKNSKKRFNAALLRKKLKLDSSKDAINHALSVLENEKKIRLIKDGRYTLNKEFRTGSVKSAPERISVGSVDKIKSGAAYIVIDKAVKDIYVPSKFLSGAFHGDTVEVAYIEIPWKKSPEGRVTKIIKRALTQAMGTFFEVKKYGVVAASNGRHNFEVYISPKDFNGATKNDRVLVDITNWGSSQNKSIWGKVSKIMTDLDQHNWSMQSILVSNGFESDFPPEVLQEASEKFLDVSDDEVAKRKDFRDVLTFTIDPDTAQDFDDAISFQVLENGNYDVGVHIADVTHYLQPQTALDKEAYLRSTSVYLVDRCIPMLPEKLSNDLCSLKPNVDRFCFSTVFEFDKSHTIVKQWIGKTIIHSDHRLTYNQAQEAIDDNSKLLHAEMNVVNDIALSLRKERFKNGSIAFETDEIAFELDEKNFPVAVTRKERKEANLLIEDFMLLSNKSVAAFIKSKSTNREIPFVYRIHDLPNDEKLGNLALLARELGLELDFSTPRKTTASFNQIAKKAQGDYAYKLVMSFAIRAMAKAVYSTQNIGHFGLKFDHYSHFTSPIRRYSDVLTHRILEKNLSGEFIVKKEILEDQCAHISKQERKAMDAERQSIKYKMVEFMSEQVGNTFEGYISGIIERGVFIELKDSKAEGFLPFTSFHEYFTMGSGGFKIIGNRSGNIYKIGDVLMVKLIDVDMDQRQMEFELVK